MPLPAGADDDPDALDGSAGSDTAVPKLKPPEPPGDAAGDDVAGTEEPKLSPPSEEGGETEGAAPPKPNMVAPPRRPALERGSRAALTEALPSSSRRTSEPRPPPGATSFPGRRLARIRMTGAASRSESAPVLKRPRPTAGARFDPPGGTTTRALAAAGADAPGHPVAPRGPVGTPGPAETPSRHRMRLPPGLRRTGSAHSILMRPKSGRPVPCGSRSGATDRIRTWTGKVGARSAP